MLLGYSEKFLTQCISQNLNKYEFFFYYYWKNFLIDFSAFPHMTNFYFLLKSKENNTNEINRQILFL